MGPAEQFGLLTSILGIAGQIVALAERAERNREKCKQLSEHVAMIMSLMTVLQSQWTPDPVTKSMLENMEVALNEGKVLDMGLRMVLRDRLGRYLVGLNREQ
jgi:hypothetical protein